MRRAVVAAMAGLLLVACASVQGQYRRAVASRNEARIRRFIQNHPESPLIADAAAVLDTVRFERAAADTGIGALQHFLQAYPQSRLIAKAALLLAERQRDLEIRRLTALVDEDPQAATLASLADLHRARGDRERADSLYRAAIERDPNHPGARTGLALSYLEQGLIAEADAEIEQAQRLAPNDVNVLLAAGEYYRLVGRPDLAIGSFQRVLNAAPDHVQAHMKLGLLYLDIGQNVNAVREFLRVRELDSKNVVSLYYLGVAYADQGDAAIALRHLGAYLNAPHTAEEADILAKAQLLYDQLRAEMRTGEGMTGGVIADPSNPSQETTRPGSGQGQARNPGAKPPASGKEPVGMPRIPRGGGGALGKKGG